MYEKLKNLNRKIDMQWRNVKVYNDKFFIFMSSTKDNYRYVSLHQ